MVKRPQKIQIIPLGGLGEHGKNMTAIRCGDDIVVIDAGLMFPEEDMFGIDLVIPDISYLLDNRDLIRAIIITHGHEEHIGALPYILPQLGVPVYGGALTVEIVKNRLQDYRVNHALLNRIGHGDQIILGNFKLGFISVNHSIPDSFAISIRTPIGTILYTGDFNFDQTPVSGKAAKFHSFAELGDSGVLALLADSTNAERAGYTGSERLAGFFLEDAFQAATGRIITAVFSSNIYSVQQILDTAQKYKRRVAIVGKSLETIMTLASRIGHLHIPSNLLISIDEINCFQATDLVFIISDNQGDPFSALTKLAVGENKKISVMSGDTIVLPAASIQGNEKNLSRIIDNLLKQGAEVISLEKGGIHVSGHASQEELKLMHNLIRPQFFIPIQGEYRQLVKHGLIAQDLGMAKENILIIDNGTVLELTHDKCNISGRVAAGNIFVDGLGVGDVGNIVLRDRRQLSQDGIVILIVTLDKEQRTILAGPDIVSRGFVYIRESEELIEEARNKVMQILQRCGEDGITEWVTLKSAIRDTLGKYLYEKIRRRPMILPIIMDA
mgnify:CR=1 FL=1